jgi:VRR-NUC domain
MAQEETEIQNEIRIALSNMGHIVWRNNVGFTKFPDGSAVKYGLCNGSSDLIGITSDGKFLAIEVKKPGGKPSKEQKNFIEVVRSKGGIAGVAHNVEEAIALTMI